MQAHDAQAMTYAEYLARERASATKHEYVNGRVYAMAGGTPEHARLAGAVLGELRAALRGKPCAAFTADLRVHVVATRRSTYPDATVVCGKLERAADDDDAVTNPTVLVEVLSESTESADRGEKWSHYQRIPSLREYVLVSQNTPKIEVFSRDHEQPELWHYREYGEGAGARVPSLEVTIEVDAVYANPLG
jgi:Uma2 family endonuclease